MSFLLFFLLSFAPSLTMAQEVNIETPAKQTTPAPAYESVVNNVIPPNNPTQNRQLLPKFGTPTLRPLSPIWFGVDIGSYYGQFDKLPYGDIFFTPYLRLWYLTIAYDLTMRFDFYSVFVTKIWKDPEALISRFSMRLYWENPKEDALFKYISLNISTNNNITLGHGRFFYSYDAAPFAPTETLKTASFAMDAAFIGVNAYLANIARPDLFSAEFYFRPLYWIEKPIIEYIKTMRFYLAYSTDTDPSQGVYNGFYDFNPGGGTPPLQHIEVGGEIPIASKKDIFLWTFYGDFSFNLGSIVGYGIAGGSTFTFFNIIPLRIEYAQGFKQWSPHFADIFYTTDRPNIDFNGVQRPSKILNMPENIGWYTVSLGIEAPKKGVFFNLELSGDQAATDLQLIASITLGQALLKIFSIDASITVRNMLGKLGAFSNSDIVATLTARYHMQPNMSWEILWRFRGQAGASFQIENGIPKPHAQVNLYQFLGLGFSYRY